MMPGRILLSLVIVVAMAAAAAAGPIWLVQTGLVPEGTLVEVTEAAILAATETGIFISEHPHLEFNGIYVELGAGHGLTENHDVNLAGEYREVDGLSILDVAGATDPGAYVEGGVFVLVVALPSLAAAEVAAEPESWESCRIKINTPMTVTGTDPATGQWTVLADDETEILFDDLWYDFASVLVGHRYDFAIGHWYWSDGAWKLQVHVQGISPHDPQASRSRTWSDLRARYR